jgi:formamidopyrimidine-DNA glycosylase
MPELPEAEAVTRRLRKQAKGLTIVEAHLERPRVAGRQTADQIAERTHRASITAINRRGKQILMRMSNGFTIRVHLGMTGDLYVIPDHRLRPNSVRTWLRLDGGSALVFDDPRVLGHFNVYDDDELDAALGCLGIEPLSKAFTAPVLIELAKGSKLPIKIFLMDQTKVSGLGNIYSAEALFRAAIHPVRRAGSLRAARLARLHGAIIAVLNDAVRSAVAAYSRPGRIREGEEFAAQVYGRKGEPCFRCGRTIQRMEQGGRSTYFCPGCQT